MSVGSEVRVARSPAGVLATDGTTRAADGVVLATDQRGTFAADSRETFAVDSRETSLETLATDARCALVDPAGGLSALAAVRLASEGHSHTED